VPVGGLGLDGQQVRLLQSLQRHYGNDHVARVVGLLRQAPPAKVGPPLSVQLQGATTCAPPEAPVSKPPQEDPKFKAVESKIQGAAAEQKKHPSAKSKVAEAQGAAVPPANDADSQAKAAQADKMGAAKPGVFDKAAFIAAVNKAIADASPKTLEEADEFSSSGKAGEVKNQVMDKVTKGKDDSAKDVKEKTGETPDPSAAKPKPVTPMAEEKPGPKAQDPGAASAMPAPAPPEQTNLGAGKCETDQKMADAEVTEEHLKKSNEPEMQQAVEAKKEGEEHSAKAPADVKAQEAQKLQTAQAGATSGTTTALDAMHQKKGAALGHVGGDKGAAKARDEAKRAEVSTHIEGIFTATKTEVDGILTGLDAKVSEKFTKGEAEARQAFEQNHKTEMERWKDERYDGISGAAQWLVDKIKGLPPEANDIYVRARNLYLSKMNQTIADVADVVGGELTRAKNRINDGRQEITKYVAGLEPELKKFGAEAEKNVASKFDDLDKDVDAKKDTVVSDLAQKYVEARNSVDASIKQMQDENKGLWDKAKAMVGDAIEAILKLKDLFMGLLAKAASAFTKIISAPLEFISNFMGALKQGFMNFASNILEHLKKGLMGWLFGALAEAGIEIPESFDFKGILKLVLSILGLTWPAIKAFIAKAFPWAAKVIDFIESKVEIIGIIVKEGVGGLWKWIKDKIGDLKDMILTPIKDFIVEKVVKAGITWVLGMLNPAGALIKIVQALISVVQWIMERGAALMDFVGTVVDAVSDIASGGMGGVPAKIEAALGRAVPLVISFLAGLLGLGGISDMIKSTFDKVRKPVMNVVHAVVGAAVKAAAPLIKGVKGLAAKVKGKVSSLWAKLKDRASAAMRSVLAKLGIMQAKKTATIGGESHSVEVQAKDQQLSIKVASSQPRDLAELMDFLAKEHPEKAAKFGSLGRSYTKVKKEWFDSYDNEYLKNLRKWQKARKQLEAMVKAGGGDPAQAEKVLAEAEAAKDEGRRAQQVFYEKLKVIALNIMTELQSSGAMEALAGQAMSPQERQMAAGLPGSMKSIEATYVPESRQGRVTVAAGLVRASGKAFVAYSASDPYVARKIKAGTGGAVAVGLEAEHAEHNLIVLALGSRGKLLAVAPSRPPCGRCAPELATSKVEVF
jgi:hypothetical protein